MSAAPHAAAPLRTDASLRTDAPHAAHNPAPRRWRAVRQLLSDVPWLLPALVAAADALAFVVVSPNVGDIWAALARESAVAHGVGLTYWFSWYGGGSVPASYSVLAPYLSHVVGAERLGALATVAIVVVSWLALRRAAPHPLVGTWVVAACSALNLWSGRIPFALGTAFAMGALLALMSRRTAVGAVSAVLAGLSSPVSGAFLALALAAVFWSVPHLRVVCVKVGAVLLLGLVAVAVVFGTPGPQHFSALQGLSCLVPLGFFLLARPPAALRTAIVLAAVACPVLVAVPNGMGTNFQRLAWYILPGIVLAWASWRPPGAAGRLIAVVAVLPGLVLAASQTLGDVRLAMLRDSSPAYFAPLVHRLDALGSALTDCRLEVVDDGSHTGAYALLDHAMLARGFESQDDRALNAPVMAADLDATTYKIWLQDNAVCYVALSGSRRAPAGEYDLVAHHRPGYLTPVWSDANWTLMRVEKSDRIVDPPVRITAFSQARLTLRVPCVCAFTVRVHYSRYLEASTPSTAAGTPVRAGLADDGFGWTTMTTPQAGTYQLDGSLSDGLLP